MAHSLTVLAHFSSISGIFRQSASFFLGAESAGVDRRCVTAQMTSQAPAVPPQKEKGLLQQQNNIHIMGVAGSGIILCRTTLNQVGDRSQ